jgi:hypothetical protein
MRSIVKNGHEIHHNAIVYSYPDGSSDLICCSDPIFREPGWELAFGFEDDRQKPAAREAG